MSILNRQLVVCQGCTLRESFVCALPDDVPVLADLGDGTPFGIEAWASGPNSFGLGERRPLGFALRRVCTGTVNLTGNTVTISLDRQDTELVESRGGYFQVDVTNGTDTYTVIRGSWILSRACIEEYEPQCRRTWGGTVWRVRLHGARKMWTAEEGGVIRYTDDAGQTWRDQGVPDFIRGYIRSVHFVRSGANAGKRGWATGLDGYVLRTDDGGFNWYAISAQQVFQVGHPLGLDGQICDFWDVFFLDDGLTGWVSGIHCLRKTVDGGANWIDQATTIFFATFEFYKFCFLHPTLGLPGLLCAEPGWVFRSTDGDTWNAVHVELGDCPLIPDEFETWDVQFHLNSVPNVAVGYVAGGQGNQCGKVLSTVDGGQTWTAESLPPAPTAVVPTTCYGVAPLAGDEAISTGYGGMVCKRTAPATPWTDITNLIDPNVVDASVRVPLLGVGSNFGQVATVVGVMNHIYRTENAGLSWSNLGSRGEFRLRDVHFIDKRQGWLVSQLKEILYTSDGGYTFTAQNPLTLGEPNLNSIRFLDPIHGVAVGNGTASRAPQLVYFEPGLSTWRDARIIGTPPSNKHLLAVCWTPYSNPGDVWAVGTSGLVMRSVNYGQTWTVFPSPTSDTLIHLSSISFDGDSIYVGATRQAGGTAHAYRLRYPTLAWQDLSSGVLGVWRAISASAGVVYASGSIGGGFGGVWQFTPTPTGAPFWTLAYPLSPHPDAEHIECSSFAGPPGKQAFFVGGERGMLARLENNVWARIKSHTNCTITGLSFLSARLGWAAATAGIDGIGPGHGGLGDSALITYHGAESRP